MKTLLYFNRKGQIRNFAGHPTLDMIDFIKTTTENIFENQSPIFTFNSWKRGSVVCDYEIKFVQPIRELSIEATGPSPADLFLANLGSAFQDIEFEPNNNQFKHHFFFNQLTDTGENVQKWTRVFRLGAESYSSLGRVGKKKKIACPLLDVFACGQVSSPRLYRLRPYDLRILQKVSWCR